MAMYRRNRDNTYTEAQTVHSFAKSKSPYLCSLPLPHCKFRESLSANSGNSLCAPELTLFLASERALFKHRCNIDVTAGLFMRSAIRAIHAKA